MLANSLKILAEGRRKLSVSAFPDETMLLLHQDVLRSDPEGHVPILDVVVGARQVVSFLQEQVMINEVNKLSKGSNSWAWLKQAVQSLFRFKFRYDAGQILFFAV